MSIPPLAVVLLMLALVVGATGGTFLLARKLSNARRTERPLTANELLAEFRRLYDMSELSNEEFQHIRAKLIPRLKAEADAAAADATSMAEATASLRGTAELLAGGWADGIERANLAGGSDQRDPSGTAGGDAHDGCDAAPPAGGDSTEGDR